MEHLTITVLLLYALYEGLVHAMEADHVLAVANIVSNRNTLVNALKDGVCWGLGHTSTIAAVGVAVIVFKVNIPTQLFNYFEAAVGVMLVLVATVRLYTFFQHEAVIHKHPKQHPGSNETTHLHLNNKTLHKSSYGIGLVHGLAGSGTLVVLVMTQINSIAGSLAYLAIFGIGSIIGMTLAAGVFSLPFSRKINNATAIRTVLVIVSSLLCLGYGGFVFYQNI
jgi:hypothetical protein